MWRNLKSHSIHPLTGCRVVSNSKWSAVTSSQGKKLRFTDVFPLPKTMTLWSDRAKNVLPTCNTIYYFVVASSSLFPIFLYGKNRAFHNFSESLDDESDVDEMRTTTCWICIHSMSSSEWDFEWQGQPFYESCNGENVLSFHFCSHWRMLRIPPQLLVLVPAFVDSQLFILVG